MIVNSKQSAKDCYIEILGEFETHKFLNVKIQKETRLGIQNRWVQQFYNMVSKQSGNARQKLVCHCKYYHGMPILLLDDPESAAIWRKMMLAVEREEDRINTMKYTAVTSLFNVKECGNYINQLVNHFDNFELPEKQWRDK